MCLDTITERFLPSNKVRFAYKGFDIAGGDVRFPCNPHNGTYEVTRGRWITAESLLLETDMENERGEIEEYESGFHCYTSTNPPHFFGKKLLRVKIRGIICKGTQHGSNVIVAKEMIVPRPKRKRKRA